MSYFDEQVRGSRGRCAIARVHIAPGTLVLPPMPAVAALSVTACSWCFRSPADDDYGGQSTTAQSAKLRRCSGCKRLKYCSSTCQQLDWTRGNHARECSAFKTIPESVRDSALQTVLLVARLTAQLYVIDNDANSAQQRIDVEQLRAHCDDHSASKLQQFRDMAQLVLALLSRFKLSNAARLRLDHQTADRSLFELVVQLFCRVNCNAFTVASAMCAPRGVGVFPQGALFNHACAPNCVVSFQAQHMVVKAIAAIAAGDELTISYIELLEPTAMRRQLLADSYFFHCDCARCKESERDDTEDALLSGYACADRKCLNGVVMISNDSETGTCRKCGTNRHIAHKRVLEAECIAIGQQLRASTDSISKSRLYERLRVLLVDGLALHARNARLATFWRDFGTFVLTATARNRASATTALELFTRELHATEWVLATRDLPPQGLLHFQLGKLEVDSSASIDSDSIVAANKRSDAVERARTHFQRALSILSRAYSADTALVRAVQAHLDELEWTRRTRDEYEEF